MEEGTGGYCQITLEAKLASRAAPALYQELVQHKDDVVVLDASKVEQIGVLAMQVLVAAAKSWADREIDFEVVGPSTAFLESAGTLGLDTGLMGIVTLGEA